jgi:hypothetical protein
MPAAASPLERAFQMARSGTCTSINDIRSGLNREGFANIDSQLDTQAIAKALRRLCDEARATLPQPQP